jgi:CRISPR-associated protein Cas2
MNFIICYDISDAKRLRKISKFIENRAIRFQYSIYFLPEPKKEKFKKIVTFLDEIKTDEDDIRIYKINLNKTISNQDIKHLII